MPSETQRERRTNPCTPSYNLNTHSLPNFQSTTNNPAFLSIRPLSFYCTQSSTTCDSNPNGESERQTAKSFVWGCVFHRGLFREEGRGEKTTDSDKSVINFSPSEKLSFEPLVSVESETPYKSELGEHPMWLRVYASYLTSALKKRLSWSNDLFLTAYYAVLFVRSMVCREIARTWHGSQSRGYRDHLPKRNGRKKRLAPIFIFPTLLRTTKKLDEFLTQCSSFLETICSAALREHPN